MHLYNTRKEDIDTRVCHLGYRQTINNMFKGIKNVRTIHNMFEGMKNVETFMDELVIWETDIKSHL